MPIFLQILLGATILLSTFLVTFAAIQVFHILSEFRQALKKLNRILENTQTLSDSAAKPIAAVNNFYSEVKTLVNDTQDRIIESTPDRVISPTSHSSQTPKRFFRRAGQFLRPS